MKQLAKLRNRWKGMIDTIIRFPLSIILLAATMVTNAIMINLQEDEHYIDLLVTFIIGSFIYAVFQLIYERFCIKPGTRYLFMGVTTILSAIYYVCIMNSDWNEETGIRTLVILFILLIAFLWVPIIKSRVNLNESFMAAFKGFFMAIFLNGVLFIGIALIYAATNMLLMTVDEKAYMHSANIIFVFLTPVYFLSLIPFYPGKEELRSGMRKGVDELPVNASNTYEELLNNESPVNEEKVVYKESFANEDRVVYKESPVNREKLVNVEGPVKEEFINHDVQENIYSALSSNNAEPSNREEALIKLTTPTKFLEALISYVIIPITAVFTIILLLYIITSITGEFWTNNLMEPMLVSYSITVIIVYLLASTINNTFSKCFRMIFPKLLIPVVLFQTLSSILKIGDVGITYGRYYVILFGIFATVAGILFSILPVKKNNLIAPVLIVLSVISIVPVTDAFTVSWSNQVSRLTDTLKKNDMLSGDTITPNSNLSAVDKKKIISSVQYLSSMNYTKDIVWLSDYSSTYNFEETFGFPMYAEGNMISSSHKSVYRDPSNPIPVKGYDFVTHLYFSSDNTTDQKVDYDIDGKKYTLRFDAYSKNGQVLFLERDGTEINSFIVKDIFDKFEAYDFTLPKKTEEVTFIQDNADSTITVIAENASINIWEDGRKEQAEVYVLVKIK